MARVSAREEGTVWARSDHTANGPLASPFLTAREAAADGVGRAPSVPAMSVGNLTDLTCEEACGSPLEQCVLSCATPTKLGFFDVIEPIVFICLSALASGLTLGLMSLDTTGLQIIVAGGEEPERSRAEKILPLRKRGNQLLCTLLLTNTLVNARLSIFLGSITSGVVGGLLATALIVIFGEIIPQATCSRHALLIGASVVEPMRMVMVLLSPICWPISKVLDRVLGDEITSGHTKREIEHVLRMQETNDNPAGSSDDPSGDQSARNNRFITSTEKKLLGGVLALSEKTAQDVMTDFDNIFMIDYNAKLDFRCLREIYRSGYTRVPVCDRSRTNLVGVLNTKDLVLVDADDELPVWASTPPSPPPTQSPRPARRYWPATSRRAANAPEARSPSRVARQQPICPGGSAAVRPGPRARSTSCTLLPKPQSRARRRLRLPSRARPGAALTRVRRRALVSRVPARPPRRWPRSWAHAAGRSSQSHTTRRST